MINQKGQAFDVFKLLIAAVVAIVILTILLAVINQIGGGIGKNRPDDAAGKLIGALVVAKSSVQTSDIVEFSSNNPQLFAKAVAEVSKYAVSTDQICISAGAFKDDDDWENTSPRVVKYKASSPKKAKIAGICDAGNELIQDLTDQGEEDMANWAGECGDCIEENEPCCFLALKKT